MTSIWIGGYTLPHWRELVTDEIRAAGGDTMQIAFLYASHTLNNAVHNVAWFVVCELEGGVTTGLLQAISRDLPRGLA